MKAPIHLPPKPEEEELRLKKLELENLQQTLVEKELYLASLRGKLTAFEKLYVKTVGVLYAELDEIEAELLKMRKPERLRIKLDGRPKILSRLWASCRLRNISNPHKS